MRGDSERRTGVYTQVYEDSSTESTKQVASADGFGKRSNEKGGLLSVKVTTANTDDRTPVPEMIKNIVGKLFGDKGYLSKKLPTSSN